MTSYNSKPAPERPSNPTGAEMALYLYEKRCKSFHDNKCIVAKNNGELSDKEIKKLQGRLDRDWLHLQRQRASLIGHARQQDLKAYREKSKSAGISKLLKEAHHPTKTLANLLCQDAEPKPSDVHEAHHIIMGKGKYMIAEMMQARTALHLFGVGINDPKNGVWLPNYFKNSEEWRLPDSDPKRPKHWATPESPPHRPIHGKNYEKWVTENLLFARNNETTFVGALKGLKRKLKFGPYPDKILQKPDPSWDGRTE